MRSFLVKAIPIVALAIFILVMLSDNYLKKPITENDDIPGSIEQVLDSVEEEDWENADKNCEILSSAWEKVANRVQFSAEKSEMDSIYQSIARLRGAIQAKDKTNAYIELHETYEHWRNIGG